MEDSHITGADGKSETLTIAVAIMALSIFILAAFQAFILIRAHNNLTTARASQEQPVQEAVKQRQRAEALAGRTAKLAEDGNANARTIVENFRRQGVDMKPPKAPTAPPEK